MDVLNVLLLIFILICALAVSLTKNLLASLIIFMCQSLAMTVIWILLEFSRAAHFRASHEPGTMAPAMESSTRIFAFSSPSANSTCVNHHPTDVERIAGSPVRRPVPSSHSAKTAERLGTERAENIAPLDCVIAVGEPAGPRAVNSIFSNPPGPALRYPPRRTPIIAASSGEVE